MSPEIKFLPSSKQYQCGCCGKWSEGIAPNSKTAQRMDGHAVNSFLRFQGWEVITTMEHRLLCLCSVCKAEWNFDPVQLHETPA